MVFALTKKLETLSQESMDRSDLVRHCALVEEGPSQNSKHVVNMLMPWTYKNHKGKEIYSTLHTHYNRHRGKLIVDS